MIKNMRILLSGMFAAAICASLLPAVALADDPSVNVSFDKTGDNTVEVFIENGGGADEAISALQLTVGVDVESGSMDGIDVDFAFSDSFGATVKESMPFNRESRSLNIYVAGGNDLLSQRLDLGTLTFTANQNAEAKLSVTVAGLDEGIEGLSADGGIGGLKMVGTARNALGGYSVKSDPVELAFQPQQVVTKPDDISTPPDVNKGNVSPIVPTPMNSSAETPQTGDALLPVIAVICAVAAVAAIVAYMSSRRNKKEGGR